MGVYLTVYAALVGLTLKVRRGFVYWVMLVGLALFSGFRYWVGCDFSGYLNNWELMRGLPPEAALAMRDPAHWLIIAILQQWGIAYSYLNVLAAVIFFFGFHRLARRQPHPMAMLAMAFPILIINMPMSMIRQAEAIGFLCMAFNAFVERAIFRYVLFVLFAGLFHSSAMVFLGLAPFVKLRFDITNIFLGFVLSLPGIYLLIQSLPTDVAVNRYVVTDLESAGAPFRLLLLALTGAFYLTLIRPLWRVQFPSDYKLVTIGAWMMVALIFFLPVSSVISDRFGYYLIPLQLVILTRLPYLRDLWSRQLLIIAPWLILTLMFVVWLGFSWHFYQCYVPYRMGIIEG